MQFLKISNDATLKSLTNQVGSRNVSSILNANQLSRTSNIGKEYDTVCKNKISDTKNNVTWERKVALLNSYVGDSDVFQTAALLDEDGWKLASSLGTFPNYLRIPEDVSLPDTEDTLGDGIPVGDTIYNKAISQMTMHHSIDPAIFNDYSNTKSSIVNSYNIGDTGVDNVMAEAFNIPWGDITLYAHLDNTSIDFPVYPEEISDKRSATYDTMSDILYQYEPWQVYKSSGPRTNSYKFTFHRDMWTGDHRDGKANELIRFCEAQCFPEFSGSNVTVPKVTLYVKGENLITGVVTDVDTHWSGPLGLDGFYLVCELEITITEVSQDALSYSAVKSKPLIG